MVIRDSRVAEDVYSGEFTTSFSCALGPDDLSDDELSKPAKDELRGLLKVPTGRRRVVSRFDTSKDGRTISVRFTDREV